MSFARFLQPKTIAVIGGREAKEVVRQCKKSGFKGDIWPVHPKKDFVEELKVYRSVEDLPHAPDAAYVAVNRQLSISVIKALAEQGAGGAICYATGFSESGDEGRVLEQQLLEASADMPLLGPNCYGLINNIEKAALWPDQQGGEAIDSGVAIVTQSSNVAINFTMQKRGLPVAYLVSLGNKLKFDLHHAIREFAQLDSVTAIGLYIEGISDPVAFESAVQYARTLGKPVVALKSGRSDTAQKIALSHTASLAGSDDLITALFSRIGVGRAYSIDSLIEALKILHVHGPLSGYKLGVMAPSGGDAILVADEVESTRFELTPLSQLHHDNVTKTVHELVTVSNPFDYQIFDWLNAERLTATYSTFVSEQFDITISIIDYPHEDRCSDSHWMPAEQALINSVESTGAKVVMLSMTLDGMPEDKAKFLMSKGIVPLSGLSAGIEALQAAADIAQVWQNKVAAPLLPLGKTLSDESLQLLDEAEAKQSLAKFNVSIPAHVIVSNAEEVSSAVKKLEFPVVAKGLGVAHKTEVGAVKLHLTSAEQVVSAIESMSHLAERFLIEEMVEDVVAEIIVGVVRDEQFGPYLVIGAGGILVELMRDSRSLLLPVNRQEILTALQSLRSAGLFYGFRGRPEADLDAAVDTILGVANFVEEHRDNIVELDINPLIIKARGQGAVAADALLRMAP